MRSRTATAGTRPPRSWRRWTPRRARRALSTTSGSTSASVRASPRTVARNGLVALARAAVPEDVVAVRGRRGAAHRDQQLDRVQRAGADLDLLWRAVLEQLAGLDPRR